MFQDLWATSVSSIAVCNSGDTHSSIWLYAELFLSCHLSISCVNDAVLLGVVGIVSVPRIMAYKPLSLAVARISLFHDDQLSLLNKDPRHFNSTSLTVTLLPKVQLWSKPL